MATTSAEPGETLPGSNTSPWLDREDPPVRPVLEGEERADVCVVGGGIVGIATAHELAGRGLDVVVVEGRRIGHGVTGNTTAKLSSLHGLTYARLTSHFGREVAAGYAEANESGIAAVERHVNERGIDCDFRRRDNFTYAESDSDRESIEEEVEAAGRAGLPVAYTETTGLPWEVVAAIRCENQAEFHPQKFVLALAEEIERRGGRIFERSRATRVRGGTVQIEAGAVSAEHVVVATHMPFLDRGAYFARMHAERSYGLGVRLGSPAPAGMYLSTESPAHSIRAHPLGGGELLIVGGESHKTGQADEAERYRSLARYARERFDVDSIEYRWAAQDNMPADGLPMVGRMWPFSGRHWVATGMKKWGLAMGMCAAEMLADGISGREHRFTEIFDPMRLNPAESLPSMASEGADFGFRFLADRVRRRDPREGIPAGEGAVVGDGIGQRAVYRDDDGALHDVSARCTHLGCIVKWNSGDKSWDCPCHGSRFEPLGEVINGPAVSPLEPLD